MLYRQPRQNILLEIGMAMGINGGLRKLTFLQRWDDDKPANQARLPSNLGGVLTIRFKKDIGGQFVALRSRLAKLGVDMETDRKSKPP